MNDTKGRLVDCFRAVLPDLPSDEIEHATSASVPTWDSVTIVSLITMVEDEFGISIEIDDLSHFDSFQGALCYLQQSRSQAPAASIVASAGT